MSNRKPVLTLADANAPVQPSARVVSIISLACAAFAAGETSIQSAKVGQLEAFKASLEGVAPLTPETWAKEWAVTTLETLKGSAANENTAKVQATMVKMVALFVTNKLTAPEGCVTFRDVYKVAGGMLREKGIIPARASRGPDSTAQGGQSATQRAANDDNLTDWFEDDDAGRKQAKAYAANFEGDGERAAAFLLVADGSPSLALMLAGVLPRFETEFRQFAAGLNAGNVDKPKRTLRA